VRRGGGRIMLGDNIGGGKAVLRPIRFQCVGAWISAGLRRMYRFVYSETRMVLTVLRLATAWTVRGLNPGGGKIFCAVQTLPEAHPTSRTIGTRIFSRVNGPDCCANHPLPSAGLRMGCILYLRLSSGSA